MNVRELIEALKDYPPDATVAAWDGDAEMVMEVTGFLFHPISSEPHMTGAVLEMQTDAD